MFSTRSNSLIALLVLMAAVPGSAGERGVPQIRLPLLKSAPAIDGAIGEEEWAGAARMERFGHGPALAPLEASFWVGSDGKELLIAVVSETPPGGKLLARIAPLPDERDARTWLDDSVELVLAPEPAASTGKCRLYHAIINARGAIHDTLYVVGGNAVAWRGHWRIASKIVGDRWCFEGALPLADLGLASLPLGQPLGIRIGRNWQQTPLAAQTEWSPLGGAYLEPATLPLVTWDAAAPVVQMRQLAGPGRTGPELKLTIFNPSPAAIPLKVTMNLRPTNSAPSELVRAVTVPPGQTVPIELAGAGADEDIETRICVASADEKTVYYLREFRWRPVRPAVVWTPDPTSVRKVQTWFAYYPSFHKIHFKTDVSDLEDKGQVRGGRLTLRRKGSNQTLAETPLPPLVNHQARVFWDVPPLGEGEYEVLLTLDGTNVPPVAHPFVRHVFPWEHNRLGKSDVVVEPFTPIVIEGPTLSTVLRKHTLGTLGLWDQVDSLGQPLLSGPMRLELTAGGQTSVVQGRGPPTVTRAGTRVATESAWQAGPLRGRIRAEWDYDGMMKWWLGIEPSAQAIERLVLVIPLRDALMPLMHACTDGLRFNLAGSTPAGQGRVWDGAKAPRNSIIGSYVPYIWLGAEERGLAVFGENDRGWSTAPGVPCQELVRQGDTLELRLNLIARPVVVDGPRRILVGLQATPTKPMPKGWRMWSESYGLKPPPGGKWIVFNGSCWSWGALTPCLDLYPRDEDFSLWEQFARTKRTGQVDDAFITQWVAGYPKQTPAERENTLAHIRCGFHILRGMTHDLLAYTNARGVRFDTREGQTFLDEWHRDAFTTRTWGRGDGVAYDLNPGESFRDYALWYYRRMLDTFVDHIYWDDIFLQSCFDVIGSEAYELPDGTVQPAAGLFDMRELIRRTAVLDHELGRTGRANQPHITNTAIAPILSFAGSHLTWEDRAGEADYQDRFSRDYIRAESLGRQHGNVPFALHLIGPLLAPKDDAAKAKRAWIDRTYAGATLIHEIRPLARVEIIDNMLQALFDYGYGTEATRVFNYWEADLPVTLSRGDAAHLVVTKPGSAMIVVCDYGSGGEVLVTLDRQRLGISGRLSAVDVETGSGLETTEDRIVKFSLKKHDFKVLRVGGQPQEGSKP